MKRKPFPHFYGMESKTSAKHPFHSPPAEGWTAKPDGVVACGALMRPC